MQPEQVVGSSESGTRAPGRSNTRPIYSSHCCLDAEYGEYTGACGASACDVRQVQALDQS